RGAGGHRGLEPGDDSIQARVNRGNTGGSWEPPVPRFHGPPGVSRGASRGEALLDEPLFAVDGGHAAGGRRRDGLPVEIILDVAGDEDPGHAGAGPVVRLDVALR